MNLRGIAVPILAVALSPFPNAHAQESDPVFEGGTRTCISTRRIRHTRIVDDNHILFYLSGKTILLNVLRDGCPGLERNGKFSFTTTTGRICKGDGLAPMNSNAWGTVRPIPHCWLGIHQEISREDADAMMAAKNAKPEPNPGTRSLPMPDPSEVGVTDENEAE